MATKCRHKINHDKFYTVAEIGLKLAPKWLKKPIFIRDFTDTDSKCSPALEHIFILYYRESEFASLFPRQISKWKVRCMQLEIVNQGLSIVIRLLDEKILNRN